MCSVAAVRLMKASQVVGVSTMTSHPRSRALTCSHFESETHSRQLCVTRRPGDSVPSKNKGGPFVERARPWLLLILLFTFPFVGIRSDGLIPSALAQPLDD